MRIRLSRFAKECYCKTVVLVVSASRFRSFRHPRKGEVEILGQGFSNNMLDFLKGLSNKGIDWSVSLSSDFSIQQVVARMECLHSSRYRHAAGA